MSMQSIANTAVSYSKSMDTIAQRLSDPNMIKDPAKVAQFQTDMFYANSGYQLASRTIQSMNQEDQTLMSLLQNS